MPKRAAVIEAEIDRRLAALVPGDSNRITAQQVLDWVRDYLHQLDRDREDFPDCTPQDDVPHLNLWIRDYQSDPTPFTVQAFLPDRMEFACGLGAPAALMDFYESDDVAPEEILVLLAKEFTVPQAPLRIERSAAVEWLGRGWKP